MLSAGSSDEQRTHPGPAWCLYHAEILNFASGCAGHARVSSGLWHLSGHSCQGECIPRGALWASALTYLHGTGASSCQCQSCFVAVLCTTALLVHALTCGRPQPLSCQQLCSSNIWPLAAVNTAGCVCRSEGCRWAQSPAWTTLWRR